MKRTMAIAAVAAVTAGGLSVAQPATAAKKYTACVKKSTGEMRLLLGKKKCKKGWKKTTWTKKGPRGDQGTPGATGPVNSMGSVVDGTGAVVGESLSAIDVARATQVFSVRIDGGTFTYLGNGWLYPLNAPVEYDNAACTGTPFMESDDPVLTSFHLNDPGFRAVYRVVSPALGPAQAWKVTGQKTAVVAAPNWYRNDSGVCTAGAAFTGDRIALTEVPAPPDRPGPLKLS